MEEVCFAPGPPQPCSACSHSASKQISLRALPTRTTIAWTGSTYQHEHTPAALAADQAKQSRLTDNGWDITGLNDETITELPDGAVEAAAALVDPARCDDGEWRVAQLIRFAWTPAPHVASYVAEKAAAAGVPPRDESGAPLPYVALHVRRGDACRCFGGCCWGNADGGGRHCFALEEYLELGATLATALNARHLLLATEDADEAARAPALAAAHGLTLVVQPWPRAAFSDATGLGDCDGDGVGGSRADVFTRIEAAMDTGAVDAEGMILSAVADMSWIADADGLVGGISLFSKVARLLALGRKGREIPFVDIAGGRARAWRATRYDAQRAGGAPMQTCTTDAHGGTLGRRGRR